MSRVSPSESRAAFAASRAQAIAGALIEAQKWCVAPTSPVGDRRRSDQYWLWLLAAEPARVDADRVHEFLASFQLAMKRTWDKPRVAERVKRLSGDSASNIATLVQSLAVDLQGCIVSKNASEQTSAASKFIFFARPKDEVFIWDRLARLSAAFRVRVRDGAPISANSIGKHFRDGSAYPVYQASCSDVLREELARSDFRDAVAEFSGFLRRIGGPMAEGNLVTRRFIERRLLDKLMFCEGRILEAIFEPRSPAA